LSNSSVNKFINYLTNERNYFFKWEITFLESCSNFNTEDEGTENTLQFSEMADVINIFFALIGRAFSVM